MNTPQKIVHNLVQGSPEWDQFRLTHDGASEAAAMLGLSKKVKRNELLRAKKTGIPREFSDWLRENVLEHGHRVEAMARPLIEEVLGEDLYPVTYSFGRTSASCDGLTMGKRTAFEHKQWNEDLAAMVAAGIVPDEHMPQCQQIMMASPAEEVYFTVSDGTKERMVYTVVKPDPAWVKRIETGWAQFHEDLDAYVVEEVLPPVTAAPIEALPAVAVRLDGMLVVNSNLPDFGAALRIFIDRIPVKPSTDQEFADTEAACKALKRAEEALEAAETTALASMTDVNEMRRLVADFRALARATRLAREKDVELRKSQIRLEIVEEGKAALAKHIAGLNTRIGRPYMPAIPADFAGVIKGKRTVTSLQDAVDTELARAKIAANEWADRISLNMRHLQENAGEFKTLFPDTAAIVLKAPEDLESLVAKRISDRKAEIRDQEIQASLDALKVNPSDYRGKSSQYIADTLEDAKQLEMSESIYGTRVAEARAAKEAAIAQLEALHTAAVEAEKPVAPPPPAPTPAAAPIEAPAAAQTAASPVAASVVPMVRRPVSPATPPATPPSLKLGQINERISPLSIDAAGMATLGYPAAAKERGAVLFHERDFPNILAAMVLHLESIQAQQAA